MPTWWKSFCAVELYLPDYVSQILPVVRASRAGPGSDQPALRGIQALPGPGDRLLEPGHRSEEQIADLEGMVFQKEWNLPHDSAMGMLVYAMVQECATALNYRNLCCRSARGGDPALERLLTLVAVDEQAH